MKRNNTALIPFMVLLFLLGLGIALYPHIHGHLVDTRIEQEAESFLNGIQETTEPTSPETTPVSPEATEPERLPELRRTMEAYNAYLHYSGQADLDDEAAYETPSFILTEYGLPDETFGVLSIPSLKLELPLYLGASRTNLAAGAAVLSATSIPIGGENTNAVIAGHRGWKGAEYFKHVDRLKPGDAVTITNLWEELSYEVVEVQIVSPDAVEAIMIQEGRDLVTLLTCHPYASGGKMRMLILCERTSS